VFYRSAVNIKTLFVGSHLSSRTKSKLLQSYTLGLSIRYNQLIINRLAPTVLWTSSGGQPFHARVKFHDHPRHPRLRF